MKKRSIISALALMIINASGVEAANIGYSNGGGVASESIRMSTISEQQAVAIRISGERAAALRGATITQLRAQWGNTSGASDWQLYIAATPDGDPITSVTAITKAPTPKWSNYTLETPYTCTGEEFYVVWKVKTTGTYTRPFGFDHSGLIAAGCAYGLTDTGWEDLSALGEGAPNLQIVSDDAPEFSAVIAESLSTPVLTKLGTEFDASFRIFNFGTLPISGLTIAAGAEEGTERITISDLNIAAGKDQVITLPMTVTGNGGMRTVSAEILTLNGAETNRDADKSASLQKVIYGADFQSKHLIEEFTGQGCVNCPSGLERMLAMLNNNDDCVGISHHSGYYADTFTMLEDKALEEFYTSYLFAPAFMVDRVGNVNGTPVMDPSSDTTSPEERLVAVREREPYFGITLSNSYDADLRSCDLSVEVTPWAIPDTAGDDITLSVYLVAGTLQSYQNGASSYGMEYKHRHVSRGTLTGDWGVPLSFEENQPTVMNLHYDIPEEILSTAGSGAVTSYAVDPDDMEFVVFVARNGEQIWNRYVYNADSIGMTTNSSNPTAVTTLHDPKVSSPQFYNTLGLPVSRGGAHNGNVIIVQN